MDWTNMIIGKIQLKDRDSKTNTHNCTGVVGNKPISHYKMMIDPSLNLLTASVFSLKCLTCLPHIASDSKLFL